MPPDGLVLGQDLVDVGRFGRALAGREARFRARVFTPGEWQAAQDAPDGPALLATRFAAKEAAFKALGTGWGRGVAWRDVEVAGAADGAPRLHLHGRAADLARAAGLELAVSLAHTERLAVALVVGWRR